MKRDTVYTDVLNNYKPYLGYLVFIFSALLYLNTWNHSFALDDYSVILEHSHVKNGWAGITDILTTNYRNGQSGFNDGLYRPLSLVSFAAEQELFEGDPRISHRINIFLYAFPCLLIFIGLKQIFNKYPLIVPLAIVLLFAAHPIHTEVVSNIKGRDDLFSLFGFAATLYFSLKLINTKKLYFWIGIILSFLFALLSKESSIVFCGAIPIVLLMNREINWKNLIPLTAVLTFLSIGFFFLRWQIVNSMPSPIDEGNFSLLNNPIAAVNDWKLKWGSIFGLQITFLHKLFFPIELIHDYSYNQIPLNSILSIKGIAGFLFYIALITSFIYYTLKGKTIGLAIGLYLLFTLIASQVFMQIGVHFAERLLFMPALAFAIIFILFVYENFLQKNFKRNQKLLLIIILVILIPFALKSINRNNDWKDNLSLYEADITKAENSARANYNLGTELSEMAMLSSNTNTSQIKLNQSAIYLRRALEIYPDYLDAANNLGIVYKSLNQPARAIELYLNNIAKDPNYTKNYYNLATAYFDLKQYENCILSMQKYVQRIPNSATAYLIMGQAAGNMNQFKRASGFLNQSLSIDPNNLETLNFLGMAYGIQKDYANAERVFNKILQLRPNDEQTFLNLSINYHQQGKLEQEVNILKSLLNIYPNNSAALQQVVLTLEALGRIEEAQNYRSKMQ